MSKNLFTLAAATCTVLLLVGCSASKPKKSGFLSSYKNLEPVDSTRMRYIGPKVNGYSTFIIDPVEMRLYNRDNAKKSTSKDREHLANHLEKALQKEVGAKYKLTTTPGPDVARLRVAVTDLKPSTPALNVLPQTKLTGMGLGEASAEVELVDSQTGEQLAAAVDSETGSRFSLSGLSKWGDVEAVMDDWAKRIRMRIDEAHGAAKAGGR
jgi:predicted component of type VI protein secretion system